MSGGKNKLKIVSILAYGLLIGILVLNILAYSKLISTIDKINKKQETFVPAITKEGVTPSDIAYNKLKEKIVENNKIEVEKDVIKSILAASKENLQAAQNYHDSIRMLAKTFQILLPLGPFLALVVAISGWIGRHRIINWLYSGLKLEERESINRSSIYVGQGYQHYKIARDIYQEDPKDPTYRRMVNLAIAYTENALDMIKKIFNPEKPRNKNEKYLVTRIFSNLAYYYAMIKEEKKFPEGLRYAKWSFEKGEKHTDFNWIENYLFFVSQFAKAIPYDEKQEAKMAFNNYKKTLLTQGICTKPEIDNYEKVFSSF